MKKLATLASASVLMVAAGQASAVAVDVGVLAQVLAIPGTQTGTGTGDVTGGVLTYTLSTVVDLGALGTGVIASTGTVNSGSPGTGTSNVSSCTGAAIICGQATPGSSPFNAITPDPLNLSETAVTTFTVASGGPNTSDATWTITPTGGTGPGPGPGPGPVIPIPAAAWLFGSALLGLVGVRRRKTSSS
ncbi:MAG: VPLPA-CTERM sorting domain-containing protein [Pseudomonadales bacterium]